MPKSKIEQYQEFQQYTNYIDTSDVMLGFYKNDEGTGLEKYFLMIQEWLSIIPQDPQKNHPLVIEGDGGVGKKTLLVKWHEYHQTIKQKSKKDLMILHFATTGGNNSNYFYAIYRILIKLREELNIGQKVQLHQEKIRKYFSYWLDVCDQKIQNESFQDLETIYQKIILVFEGIDYFLDRGNGKQGNIAFWLPKYFPKNVKVIVTADGQSQSMKYFNSLGCHKVLIPSDASLVRNMMKWQTQKPLCIFGQIKGKLISTLQDILKKYNITSLFVKSYLSCLLPEQIGQFALKKQSLNFLQVSLEKIDWNSLKGLSSSEELFQFFLKFWGKILIQQNQNKFKELLGILIHTQKGLTLNEIVQITDISEEQLKIFITIFRTFLMNFKDLWMIKNDCFKKVVSIYYNFQVAQMSDKIAETLKKTPNSVRKLEEETFQLYTAGNFFRLKQVISDIQNFLLLFNPYTKYDLCKYWQKLEEKSFDPVIQYNKAIEGFQMHYHPSSDDLFRIITQISRFLKQFSDFQTFYTPQFRHPFIVGNRKQLEDIGILGEIKNLQMCEWEQQKDDKMAEQQALKQVIANNGNSTQNSVDKGELKLKQKLKQVYEKIDQIGKSKKNQCLTDTFLIENEKKVKKIRKRNNPVHQLNVQVKSNQEAFRSYYHEQIKPFLQKINLDGKQQLQIENDNQEQQYEDSDKQQNQSGNLVAKIKSIERQKDKQKAKLQELPNLKKMYVKTVQEEFQLNQKPPTNYYYKRWIWMQFPWVCMAMKCDYSDKLRKCFTSPTSYMTVSEQRQFTLQALKIALQAKKKKQAILEKTEQIHPRKRKQVMIGPYTENTKVYDRGQSKFQQSRFTSKSKQKSKLQELGFVTNSFLSLKNLEKQMNEVNKNLAESNIKNKQKRESKDKSYKVTEGPSVFLTSEQKTYQQYSSLLHSMNKKRKRQILCQQDLNMTSTSVRNRTNNSTKQGILPRIKQNINNQMVKELQELQKNNSNMRKQVDCYQYKNRVLAKKLKQLKIIQFNNTNKLNNEKKVEQLKQKIKQYEKKIEKVKYQYAFSILQHERLNVLIKICQQNKTQNEECIPDLVSECNNIKKMISMEKAQIAQLYQKINQIKKITKKFLKNCYEKVKNQTILNQEISNTLKNRDAFQEQVEKYDEMILQEIDGKRKELNQKARSIYQQQAKQNLDQTNLNNSNYLMIQNSPQKNRRSFHVSQISHQGQINYQQMYQNVLEHLDIEEDPENTSNYEQSQKYKNLLTGLHKKKELQTIISERKVQLEELNKKCNEERRLLQTLVKVQNNENQKQQNQNIRYVNKEHNADNLQVCSKSQLDISDSTLNKRIHEKQRSLKKLTDIKLSCLGMLNTWHHQLGLKPLQSLKITPQLIQKIREAKQLQGKDNYCAQNQIISV